VAGGAGRERRRRVQAALEQGDRGGRAGRADGIAVWNLSRFSRCVRDALNALERVESAGGRVWSATERTDDRMLRTILLAVAENEGERIRAGFAASTASAVGARRPCGGQGCRWATGAARTSGLSPTPTQPRSCWAPSSAGRRAGRGARWRGGSTRTATRCPRRASSGSCGTGVRRAGEVQLGHQGRRAREQRRTSRRSRHAGPGRRARKLPLLQQFDTRLGGLGDLP
jgi:hypothetical protein